MSASSGQGNQPIKALVLVPITPVSEHPLELESSTAAAESHSLWLFQFRKSLFIEGKQFGGGCIAL